jgi:ABC-2 type transport system permease protein
MRKVWVIAVREYLAAVRTKAFIISLLLMPVLMGGSIVMQIIFKKIEDRGEKHFAIIDRTPGEEIYKALEKAAEKRNQFEIFDPETNKQVKPSFKLERIRPSDPDPEAMQEQRFELSQQILAGKYFGLLEIGADVYRVNADSAPDTDRDESRRLMAAIYGDDHHSDPERLRYQTKMPQDASFSLWAEKVVNEAVQEKRWAERRQPRQQVLAVLRPVPLAAKGLSRRDSQTGRIIDAATESQIVRFIAPVALILVMFMMIMVGATPLLGSVLEEKMGRIAEVMLGSVRPFQLMMGKLTGMIGTSLTVSALYLSGLYFVAHRYGLTDFFSFGILAWFLVYLVLAMVFYGSIFAALGSACTTSAEAQSFVTPVILVAVIPMMVLVHVIQEPNDAFSTAISFFPPCTPMMMIARLAVPPGLPWWEPVLGAVLLLATTAGFVYAAGRIFRVGLLMQGQGAKLHDLARWVIQG